MKISREMKKEEAIKRMKELGIISDAIRQFRDDDIVMVSEPPFGGLYWLDDSQKEMVKKFEEEYNVLVYMVVKSFTNFGEMDSLLYVSDYKEDWMMEHYDVEDRYISSYTINYDMPDCSEYGCIGVKPVGGGLVRIF